MRANHPRARQAAYVAAIVGCLHSLATAYWASGGTLLFSTLGQRITTAFAGRLWLLWAGVAVKLVVALTPLILLQRAGPRSRLVLATMWIASGILCLWGGANTFVGNLVLGGVLRPAGGYDRQAMIGHAWLWDPMFLVWGVALAIALISWPRVQVSRRRPE